MVGFENQLKHLEHKLMAGIAERYQVSENNVILESGADGCLALIFKYLSKENKKLLIPVPGYNEFRRLAETFPLEIESYNALDKLNFSNLPKESESFDSAILIGCPINPIGKDVAELEDLLSWYEGLIIIDDVYRPMDKSSSIIGKRLTKHKRVLTIRSFSKVYSRPEIRVGYIVGPQSEIETLKKLRLTYPLSSNSLLEANKLVVRPSFYESKYKELCRRANEISKTLSLDGQKCHYSFANFLSVEFDSLELALAFSNSISIQGTISEVVKFSDKSFFVKITIIDSGEKTGVYHKVFEKQENQYEARIQ